MNLRLLAALALLALGCITEAQRAAQVVAPPDFPIELVARGASGYALTAGADNVIERFDITVLGVQHDAGNGFPLVLVRASGPFIESVGGVAAGMSGSPVYLPLDGEDALLGAIGYVFPDADHSVALVTPIGAMRDDRVFAAAPAATPGASAIPESASVGAPSSVPTPPAWSDYGVAVPVATPILLSGADSRATRLLAPLFAGTQVVPFPTQVSGVAVDDTAYELVPGAAIAVRLMSGDFDLAAIGTLTTLETASETASEATREATREATPEAPAHSFLAFGHPFLGSGTASYAVSGAHVLEIVASNSVPFKLANVGQEIIGAVQRDTPAALHGTIGTAATTVPLTLTINSGAQQQRFEVALAADQRLYPTLTAIAALRAADRLMRSAGPGHAALAWELELGRGRRVNVMEQTSSDSDIGFAAAVLAGGPLAILAANAFEDPALEAIELSITLSSDPNSATIESLVLEEDPVRAGDNAILHVRLQPFRQPAVVRTFSVPLTADMSGELTLLVRGGDVPREIEGVPEEGGESAEPRSFPELLDALRAQLQASELVVEAIDEYGEVKRLLRVALPFVVLGSEDLIIDVEASGDKEPDEQPDEAPAPAEAEPDSADGSVN